MALLSVRGVNKRFGAVQALAGVDLDFDAGEIHAVLGENGAGKSTLMHVLAGILRPDSGTVLLEGGPVSFRSPGAARAAGIGMVHQHFTLIEALTVAENLVLSLPGQSGWRFDREATAAEAQELAARIGLALSPCDQPVHTLPVGARQRLEILKALAGGGRALILDEPTAVLTPAEVQHLFGMLRELRAQGRAIVFITHKLHEVRAVADRVTIMRRGRVITTVGVDAIGERGMAEQMVGEVPPPSNRPPRWAPGGAPDALRVDGVGVTDLRGVAALTDVALRVQEGQIFGIAGVDGNGQRELFEVLVGLRPPHTGRVFVGERQLSTFSPRAAHAAGIGHIPPDRRREGLALTLSVAENFLLNRSVLDQFGRGGFLQTAAARQFAARLAEQYAIQFAGLDESVQSLSGGNQQRVIVARELAKRPRVLVAVNPTRGLDVQAARAVANALLAVAAEGCALVLISTDLDEVLELSDRVSVLARGRLSEPIEPPIDAQRLGLLMAGAAA
jgi:ABC-type uncharacterized transport system ATPase subunit